MKTSRAPVCFVFVLALSILFVGASAKKRKENALKKLVGEIRTIVKLGLDKGMSVDQVCSDACGLLDNDRDLDGTPMREHLAFCESQCPQIGDPDKKYILDSDEALEAFIHKTYQHEEL